MKTKLIAILLLFTATISAQQDAQFTQYMYNTINVNPAYAGSRQSMSIFALYRTQWVGLDGAPVTNTASINFPINESKVGLGVSVINDKIGPSDESNLAVDFSYYINTSEDFKLAFGMKASANLLSVNFSKLKQYENVLEGNIDNRFSPNIGVGLYWYSDNTYVGLSAPNLLETKHFDRTASQGSTSYIARERVNYYLTAGHVFDLTYNLKFKPAMMTKLVQGAPLQVDLSANFMFNEKFTAGLAYRWSAALSALVGFQVSDSWFIGYGYDLETTRLANYNSGSHEIFLRYEIFNKYNRITSPRFF
ncbi:type IX secretion system membrane protein PorP/SprF [Flavobacterium sp. F-328]|uniref:Type IX secretion system membrane protein PorP/SprF n=1 Tax=Flavobacterium erciyesense TaxID=2825842 RepID=A0ABS5D4X0_9FLAO|nr:type IX secretion system membrane protein PorP/SprF [Flavobacterium erciyesense]MBQ0909075.1 type IX secretion system membrane protein PorP/SprF [Flavobacterium erciyesense]